MATHTHIVDPTNLEQAKAWDGSEGAFWANHSDEFDRAVRDYHKPFMNAAHIQPTDRVLDVGCGNGETTFEAASLAPEGEAVGIDLSTAMIGGAQDRAQRLGVKNAKFVAGDAQIHRFEPGAYDAAISRTGAMFFGDQVAAFTNIAHALRADARLVLLSWGSPAENGFVELINSLTAGRSLPAPTPDSPGPFALSDPERVTTTLQASGFRDVELEGLTGSMWFGDSPESAEKFVLGMLGWMLDGLSQQQVTSATETLRTTLAKNATDEGVQIRTGALLITARRDRGRS